MKTFWAMVNIDKGQLKGSANVTRKHNGIVCMERVVSSIVPTKPRYETQAEITKAIANGTFQGFAPTEYAKTKVWEAYQAKLNAPKFFKKGASKPMNGNNFTFQFTK